MTLDPTRRLLVDAGIGPDMRVLDLGCGRGEVSLMVAGLVGPSGIVVGIDRDRDILDVARGRVRDGAIANVRFEQADLADLSPSLGAFDAVVGRRVLMYQPDAVATLVRVAALLDDGGLVVLQEHDPTAMPICLPAMPLHRQVHCWIWRTVAAEGADLRMGLRLAPTLAAAGFAVQETRAETTLLTATQPQPIGTVVRAILHRIVAAGVATADEIDVDTLDARLDAERRAANGTCVWELVFGAWGRKRG